MDAIDSHLQLIQMLTVAHAPRAAGASSTSRGDGESLAACPGPSAGPRSPCRAAAAGRHTGS